MVRRSFWLALVVAALGLALASPALAQPAQLFPGTTYESGVQFTPHGPVALHIVRGPKPVGLYRLQPVLSNDRVIQRERVSAMQRRLTTQATAVGINGNLFSLKDGRPSGILMRDGVLVTPPNPERSSVGVTLDGLLDVRRVGFRGTWRGQGQRRSLNFLNKAPGNNGIALFTSDWGPGTPRVSNSYAVVLGDFPPTTPNTDLVVPVLRVSQGGSIALAPGTAVLVARGNAAARLREEAPLGSNITLRLILQPDWSAVADAIGGGPILVRAGAPVYRSNEAFTTSQLAPRGPRSAVGQRGDGSILFVTTDGRQPGYSVGMTNFELAQTLVRLGAVSGMALDGGGSATLAFDGELLNRPSGGSEREVADALMLQYYGVYAPPPLEEVVSPNGDGVAEQQKLAYKVVRPSQVSATLAAPDGTIAYQTSAASEPGIYEVPFPPPVPEAPPPPPGADPVPPPAPAEPLPPAEGRWTLTVTGLDDQGLNSTATRRFWVNSTLGFMRLGAPVLRLRPKTGGAVAIRWTQSRAARVRVTVETREGLLVRTVASSRFEAGEPGITWNGKQGNGKLAPGGPHVVRVTATNELGTVALEQSLTVRRLANPKR